MFIFPKVLETQDRYFSGEGRDNGPEMGCRGTDQAEGSENEATKFSIMF